VSNLNSAQFDRAFDIEAQQTRKKMRRGLEGAYAGIGSNYANYPYMIGAMGTGGDMTAHHEQGELSENMGETAEDHVNESMGAATNGVVDTQAAAPTSDGGGIGGTMTSAVAM
jgi:hypothetical protein